MDGRFYLSVCGVLLSVVERTEGQALLSSDSTEDDVTKLLVPIAIPAGVVLLAAALFIYFICRLRVKQGKPVCCCCHGNDKQNDQPGIQLDYHVEFHGYNRLSIETKNSGVENKTFQNDDSGVEIKMPNSVTKNKHQQDVDITNRVNKLEIAKTQYSSTAPCETCSKCLHRPPGVETVRDGREKCDNCLNSSVLDSSNSDYY